MIAGLETHEVTHYRPTKTQSLEGDRVRVYGEALKTEIPAWLVQKTMARGPNPEGIRKDAEFYLICDDGLDFQTDDVLRVTAGPTFVGKDFLVLDAIAAPQNHKRMVFMKQTNDGPAT